MEFQIRKAINNVYSAVATDDGRPVTLRIKGKVLKGEREYNPIAVGDIATGSLYSEDEGLITGILPRKSAFTRWNVKAELNQTISANHDMCAIVLSSFSPPFRPRFVDRAIACSRGAEILLVMNKSDYGLTEEEFERWALYKKLGFSLIAVSAKTGEGLKELKKQLLGKTTCFVGQSGVGKSSLVNAILGAGQKTGEVSVKYNRGRHTTNHALYLMGEGFAIIDTPGVREIQVPFEKKDMVMSSFPELENLGCYYPDCLHTGEEGCVVPRLINDGRINEDRYYSYLKIIESLERRSPLWERNKGNGK